ncbi:MAG: helix-turn-helix domain-containing protein [Streptosporangiales bacterium]|nr:helix-turn-helix domain-containing protein [Streptosporangiales bacterium]
MPEERRADVVQSLQRGLAVIKAFTPKHANMTVSQVAERTGLTRPTVRRVLITLEDMGYARYDGRAYSLSPRVLELGYAYLSSVHLWDAAFPIMDEMSGNLGENCLAGVFDGTDVVCVARTTKRMVTVAVYIGGRIPAFATSLGRAILAYLEPAELDDYFANAELKPVTRHTVTEEVALRRELAKVRKQGWSIVENELEEGLTSVAVPVFGTGERVVASLNISVHGNRLSRKRAEQEVLPALQECASQVSILFGARLVFDANRPVSEY